MRAGENFSDPKTKQELWNPGFEAQLHVFWLPVLGRYYTSVSLGFCICKLSIIRQLASEGCPEDSVTGK